MYVSRSEKTKEGIKLKNLFDRFGKEVLYPVHLFTCAHLDMCARNLLQVNGLLLRGLQSIYVDVDRAEPYSVS